MAVRLAAAEVIPYALPFRRPYVTARGTLARREMVLLRLRDEDGVEGLGEAVPLSLRGGVTLEAVARQLRTVAVEMTEAKEAPPSIADALADRSPIEGGASGRAGGPLSLPARCALSTALLDLRERREGRAVAAEPVRCNATLVGGAPGEVAAEAARWAKAGFRTFKLKVGTGEDVAQVEAVRAALGPEAKIRLDANATWSLEEATRVLAAIEPLGIELVEQPVETIGEAAELAWRTRIPLAGDESIVTVADAKEAERDGGFSITGIKLSKVGGIAAGRQIAAVLRSYVASALDGPVGIAVGRRLAAEIDAARPADVAPLAHGLATRRLFAATVAAVECELRGDLLHAAPGPGLGVVIDEDALEHHQL